MARSLSLVPLASFACWRGRSTAGPSHYRTLATPKLFYLSSPSVEFRQLHWRILIFGGIIGRNFQKTFCFLDLRQFRPLAKADQGWSKQLAGGLSPACRLIELCK